MLTLKLREVEEAQAVLGLWDVDGIGERRGINTQQTSKMPTSQKKMKKRC